MVRRWKQGGGESGVIELPENPTTGGVWTLNVNEETGTASLQ
jgi:predicted secreted protein